MSACATQGGHNKLGVYIHVIVASLLVPCQHLTCDYLSSAVAVTTQLSQLS